MFSAINLSHRSNFKSGAQEGIFQTSLSSRLVIAAPKHDSVSFSANIDRQLLRLRAKKLKISDINHPNNNYINLFRSFLASGPDFNHQSVKIFSGANGSVYKVSKEAGKNIAVKVPHFETVKRAKIVQRLNANYDDEVAIMKMLPDDVLHTSRLLATGVDESGKISALALEFVPGKMPDPKNAHITQRHLDGFYDDLFALDKAGIYHRDLTITNLKVTKDNIYITDYGASKTFEQMKELSKGPDIKYKHPSFLALSNLDNFESIGLLVYLRQLSNSSRKGKHHADRLFLTHLSKKSSFHAKKSELLRSSGSSEDMKLAAREKLLSRVFGRIKLNQPDAVTMDIRQTELLRLKMLQAQKMTRLYADNDQKNPATSLYWNSLQGFFSKQLELTSSALQKQYRGDKDLEKYFIIQNKISKFHQKEIFMPMFNQSCQNILSPIKNSDKQVVANVVKEGNWLQFANHTGRWKGQAASMYEQGPLISGDY
ncbi:MAG: hypothetical protein PHE78_01910 [Candidatus Gastranaerophilales bacterium]|nr:hypothetical protein [Candidatus Gastranaerophilales bacterium]